MARILIMCRQAHALLSGQCDNALDWRQRLLLRLHLLGCDTCSIVQRNFAFLSRALHRLDADVDAKADPGRSADPGADRDPRA